MTDTTPPRRGLGRGLGSLIPTTPPAEHSAGSTGTAVVDRTAGSPDWIGRLPGATPPAQGSAPDTTAGEGSPSDERSASAVEAGSPDLVAGAWFAELPVASITPNARQPRQVFEEEPLAELVHSIR